MYDKINTFEVAQKVVYPSQGVGVIVSIEDKEFKNEKIPYYKIYLEVSDMTIMVPVSKAESLGIRTIVSQEDANKAINLITEDYDPIPTDWKIRYQMNLDLLKKGSVMDIACIVRSLYHRSKVKELPILERKLYDSALKLLEDEISVSLNLSKEEVENMIIERLENKPVKESDEDSLEEDFQIVIPPIPESASDDNEDPQDSNNN